MGFVKWLNDALDDPTIRLLVELIDRATNWERFGRAFRTPMDGSEIAYQGYGKLRTCVPTCPTTLKVLIKAEVNRSRIHWHATDGVTLSKQKDVMKSPFKDERLEVGFGNLETLKDFLMDYLYQYITYPKRALLLRALNRGETSGWFAFDQFKGYEDEVKGVWREFEAAIAKGDIGEAKKLGEELLQYTWGA
jgi:hypothetical protein